jgi:SAM-dependent methyltransferase
VLDVGCGDGYFLGNLPDSIETKLGVDLSIKAISFAKAFHPECDFRVEDVGNITTQFDIVSVIEVLEHIPDDQVSEFLCALSRRINDTGTLIISVPTTVLPLNNKHYRHYDIQILNDQIIASDCDLKLVEVEYIYSSPWWFKLYQLFSNNKLFYFEFKPFIQYSWKKIWNEYRYVDESKGYHLVAYFKKI